MPNSSGNPLKARNRILLVDDETNIRDLISRLLSRHGYSVDSAENAAEAMKHLKRAVFDLVILDVVLLDGDGMHFAKLIKKMQPGLPILLLSGIGFDDQLKAQAKEAGAAACVSNTAPLSKMVAAVRRVLADPQRLTEGFTEIIRKAKPDSGP